MRSRRKERQHFALIALLAEAAAGPKFLGHRKPPSGRPGACTFGHGALKLRTRNEERARKHLVWNIRGNNDRYDNDSPMMTMMSLLSGPVGQGNSAAFLTGILAFFPPFLLLHLYSVMLTFLESGRPTTTRVFFGGT